MHENLKIVYEQNKPYGIRDQSGFLLFFANVTKYNDQEERYRNEVQEQFKLAYYILASLKNR